MKPMFASMADPGLLEGQLPILMSPKINGFRSFIHNGHALTRSFKPQANAAINQYLSDPIFNGLDSELACGDITDPKVFQKSSGDLRRRDGEPDWSFHRVRRFHRSKRRLTNASTRPSTGSRNSGNAGK